jgi:hypothetical protein
MDITLSAKAEPVSDFTFSTGHSVAAPLESVDVFPETGPLGAEVFASLLAHAPAGPPLFLRLGMLLI